MSRSTRVEGILLFCRKKSRESLNPQLFPKRLLALAAVSGQKQQLVLSPITSNRSFSCQRWHGLSQLGDVLQVHSLLLSAGKWVVVGKLVAAVSCLIVWSTVSWGCQKQRYTLQKVKDTKGTGSIKQFNWKGGKTWKDYRVMDLDGFGALLQSLATWNKNTTTNRKQNIIQAINSVWHRSSMLFMSSPSGSDWPKNISIGLAWICSSEGQIARAGNLEEYFNCFKYNSTKILSHTSTTSTGWFHVVCCVQIGISLHLVIHFKQPCISSTA